MNGDQFETICLNADFGLRYDLNLGKERKKFQIGRILFVEIVELLSLIILENP